MTQSPETLYERAISLPRAQIKHAAMAALSGLQKRQPAAQVMAAALIFTRMCRIYGVHPGTFMQLSNNAFTDGERVTPEFRAVDDYIKGELSNV